MNLHDIYAGVAERLETIDGLRVLSHFGADTTPPAAAMSVPTVEYDATKGDGLHMVTFVVWVVLGPPTERPTQERAFDYASTAPPEVSVKGVLEADPTLGGAAATLRVVTGDTGVLAFGNVEYLTTEYEIEIYAE